MNNFFKKNIDSGVSWILYYCNQYCVVVRWDVIMY